MAAGGVATGVDGAVCSFSFSSWLLIASLTELRNVTISVVLWVKHAGKDTYTKMADKTIAAICCCIQCAVWCWCVCLLCAVCLLTVKSTVHAATITAYYIGHSALSYHDNFVDIATIVYYCHSSHIVTIATNNCHGNELIMSTKLITIGTTHVTHGTKLTVVDITPCF